MFLKTMSTKEAMETFGKQLFERAFVYIPDSISSSVANRRVQQYGYKTTPCGKTNIKTYVTKIEDGWVHQLGNATAATIMEITPTSSLRAYATRVVVEDFEWEFYHKELCT